jgi:hypothetical protein
MVINKIPSVWKDEIKKIDPSADPPEIKIVTDLQDITFSTKQIYDILTEKKYKPPIHQNKWLEYFPLFSEIENIWNRIYMDLHFNVRQTKVQSLQYKLIFRIVNCRKKLFDWNLTIDKNCPICKVEDSIQHFFIECNPVRQFWRNLIDWWNNKDFIFIDPYREELRENLLFGFLNIDNWYRVLNFVIVYAKWYIYKSKLVNNNVYLTVFLKDLKLNIKNEINIQKLYYSNKIINEFVELDELL